MVAGRNKVDRNSASAREKGFTLIELLIAIFIFAIVVSAVYGSYRATFYIVQGSESQLRIANSARIVVERLSEDLDSLVIGPGGEFLGERHDYSGQRGDSLTFVSYARLILSKADTPAGPALIKYQIEPNEETGLLDLYRSDSTVLPGTETKSEDMRKHLICRGLQEFKFTYLDQDGNETEEWQVGEATASGEGSAAEKSTVPSLVSLELKFAESADSKSSTVFKTAFALQFLQEK